MQEIRIKPLDQKRFNAFVGATRSPAAAYVSHEISWHANEEETVLGAVLIDTVDDDYVGVVLGRDEGGRFRAIDLQCSIRQKRGQPLKVEFKKCDSQPENRIGQGRSIPTTLHKLKFILGGLETRPYNRENG